MTGFVMFGLLVLLWMLIWKGLLHAFAVRHSSSPWAQGLAAYV
jgi:hypothetical protein